MSTMVARDDQKSESVLAGHRSPPMFQGRAIDGNRRSADGRVAFLRARIPMNFIWIGSVDFGDWGERATRLFGDVLRVEQTRDD